jgi:pimeloyl-ACP methyl ester carboxylesterase
MATRLSWDRAGSGEPLLLLHGIGTTRDDFSALRPALEAEYDVLAVDLPGHGANVRCPVILAQGTADVIGSGQTPRYLMLLPGATFQPLLGAGHAPQSDSPDSILRLVHQATQRVDSLTAR